MATVDYAQVGQRIRQARVDQGYTLSELSGAVGISLSYLGHIERGTRAARPDIYVLLAEYLHISLDYILRGLSLWEAAVECHQMRDERSQLVQQTLRMLREAPPEWER